MAGKKGISVSNLSSFMAREALNDKSMIDKIVNGVPEELVVTGDVLGPLTLSEKVDRSFVLRVQKAYFSRFRAGDLVDLSIIDGKTRTFKKLKTTTIQAVRFPEPGVLEVVVPGDSFMIKGEIEVFLLPVSAASIKWMLRKKLQLIADARVYAEHTNINHRLITENFEKASEKLNQTQKEALRFLKDNDFKGLVQGPPGTGKTHLLVDLIRLLVQSKVRVGLASLTHTAVDNALSRVLSSGLSGDLAVRIASDRRKVRSNHYKGAEVDKVLASSFKVAAAQESLGECNKYLLYAATLHAWCLGSNQPDIDVLIIDEASQVPIYFHPFLRALSPRVILFGDHKQLPPVVQVANHNLPAEDIFSYEIGKSDYPMLEIQYRMNKGVQEWSSNRFYEGRLQPHESNRNRDLIQQNQHLSPSLGDNVVNLIRHQGPAVNNANRIEASRVADLVFDLNSKGGMPFEEIGIVTPHRSHAGAIGAALQQKLGLKDMQKILVDTVERFQGQEREAMILSMGVEKDNSRKGDKGFLGDGRRLNVAATRTRSRLYCFAPNKLVETTKKQKNAEHLKSFLDWCSTSKENKPA